MKQPDERITKFIATLEKLDPGERARLKRNAGKRLDEARSLGLFYRILPYGVPRYQEEMYFLVATLYPLAEGCGEKIFGASMRRARDSQNEKGLNRRMEVLLDTDERQLPFRLRQAVRYLYSKRVPVNWPCLLRDLLQWNAPKRYIQQAWARAYFAK
ncbi:MAG: type I-E CRISPR-associated protein Cse2/CasB [Anaerolineales bacterium]|nr:type I-E CRISPR-associated protein Cse2/CasB [Anaerolineales bacterium]